MSAVPKKKLCWNCEGNVSREIDNCPYCGVYLHAEQEEEMTTWGFSSRSPKEEDIPTPLYQSNLELTESDPSSTEEISASPSAFTFNQLKKDLFPLLLLMAGSIFFLFGIVLFLFSENGALTLQWNSRYWPLFLLLSLPFMFLGWRYLQQIESDL